ncbi:hypothetical protein SPI_01291 [Niveomyces insectorum RCEF 264]|uniref:Major facilitator superfamily transporter n=1 Tax=Niveomyces insectorum RCEF 264 TaxID=1081102 RepID=A0A167YUS5_9HYPO|nr:hypothetical protein SPI_01291 [Niveomyces insectorum RCEF 264]
MGFPDLLSRSRNARQRLPLYEQGASPAPAKERLSDEEAFSSDDGDDDDEDNDNRSNDDDDDDDDDDYDDDDYDDKSARSPGISRQSSGSASATTMMLPKRVRGGATVSAFAAPLPRRRQHQQQQQQRHRHFRRPTTTIAAVRARVYRLPNKVVRCLCIAMMMTLFLFIGILVRASQVENFRIASGHFTKAVMPPAWESFGFLTRYYGGVRGLVSLSDNVPQYPREEDEQPYDESTASGGGGGAQAAPELHLHPAPVASVADADARAKAPLPPSTPFDKYPGSSGAAAAAVPCFLDAENTVSIPSIRYYEGRPTGFPLNAVGSYELLSLPEDICFERYGRYGPYGYGYSVRSGGLGVGGFGEDEGAKTVWDAADRIDYRNVDWADVQQRCYRANARRFKPAALRKAPINGFFIDDNDTTAHHVSRAVSTGDEPTEEAAPVSLLSSVSVSASAPHAGVTSEVPAATASHESLAVSSAPSSSSSSSHDARGDLPRTAVVVRCWDEFEWREDDILNMRSLIAELALASGARYDVHLLVQIKNDAKYPVWADDETYRSRIEATIPAEFRGLVTLWSETQMLSLYQGIHDLFTRGPGLPVHGVYRGLQMAMQYFAHNHPEYEHFWQWEMDIRYTGHHLDLFTKMENWAAEQPRKGLWERNARFYVPSVHGSWDDFQQMARVQTEVGLAGADNLWDKVPTRNKKASGAGGEAGAGRVGEETVWGPVRPADPNDWFESDNDPVPPTTYEKDRYVWGVGEQADLVTLNPLFDPEGTTWLLADDITGYNATAETLHGAPNGKPPRRAQIITASRMSRRLLRTMHLETALKKHHAFPEMWPATVALQHGYKAVYVPHPVYVDREWPLQYLARTLNGGRNGATGGSRTSVFGQREHNFQGFTWYYNAGFSPNVYRRWLGLKVNNDGGGAFEEQMDATKDDLSVSTMRGGEGRMCLPPMLLHPIKHVELPVESHRNKADDESATEADPGS